MSITITDELMSSHRTRHVAARDPEHNCDWRVSWLPGGTLTWNQATTAMILAEEVADGTGNRADKRRGFIEAHERARPIRRRRRGQNQHHCVLEAVPDPAARPRPR